MKITKYEDAFELLTEERMAVIEDMNVEDLKETIGNFAMLAALIGEIEVIKQVVSMVQDDEDKTFLRSLFKKGKSGANLALENFMKLTSTYGKGAD